MHNSLNDVVDLFSILQLSISILFSLTELDFEASDDCTPNWTQFFFQKKWKTFTAVN